MAGQLVRLNHAGVAEILKSAGMSRVIEHKAREVAENVRDLDVKVGDRNGGPAEYDLPVIVQITTTDRIRGAVILAHPAGLAVQAKHGALTKAASEAGLEVHGSD